MRPYNVDPYKQRGFDGDGEPSIFEDAHHSEGPLLPTAHNLSGVEERRATSDRWTGAAQFICEIAQWSERYQTE